MHRDKFVLPSEPKTPQANGMPKKSSMVKKSDPKNKQWLHGVYKVKKMKISFNDSATSTYEYPSEQSLLDTLPSQPGDYDYPGGHGNLPNGNVDEEVPDLSEPSSSLKSTPGLGSGGALGMYKSKLVEDYEIGQHRVTEERPAPRRQPEPQPVNDHAKPAENDTTWSDSTISDMLF